MSSVPPWLLRALSEGNDTTSNIPALAKTALEDWRRRNSFNDVRTSTLPLDSAISQGSTVVGKLNSMSLSFQVEVWLRGASSSRNPPSSLIAATTTPYSGDLKTHRFGTVYIGACPSREYGSRMSFCEPPAAHIQCLQGNLLVFGDHISGDYQDGGNGPFAANFSEIVHIIDVEQERGTSLLWSFALNNGPRLSQIHHWSNVLKEPTNIRSHTCIRTIARLLQDTVNTGQHVTLAVPSGGLDPADIPVYKAEVRSRVDARMREARMGLSDDQIATAHNRFDIEFFAWGDESRYDKAMELHEEAQVYLEYPEETGAVSILEWVESLGGS